MQLLRRHCGAIDGLCREDEDVLDRFGCGLNTRRSCRLQRTLRSREPLFQLPEHEGLALQAGIRRQQFN